MSLVPYELLCPWTEEEQKKALSMIEILQHAERNTILKGKSEPSFDYDNLEENNVLLLVIDLQNDFMEPNGSLAVPGSRGDAMRLTRFIYDNLPKIDTIITSLDLHSPLQIFHPLWWSDKEGKQPAPFTIITYDEVKEGLWKPIGGTEEQSLRYLYHLQQWQRPPLCIWPYHCLEGTYGADFEPNFARIMHYHAALRRKQPFMIRKGQNPFSEMYGIIKHEDYTLAPDPPIIEDVMQQMIMHNEIYIAGEAASHCLKHSCQQIVELFRNSPLILQSIHILTDCTSIIPGFEQSTYDALNELRDVHGFKLVQSSDIVLN